MITYGGMSRESLTIPTSLFIFKRIQAKGFWLSKWFLENPSHKVRQEIYQDLFSLMRKGYLREPIHQKWNWSSMDDDSIFKIGHFESPVSRSSPIFSTGKRILVQ
jgi:trans-2-enoyl-CoA reductase